MAKVKFYAAKLPFSGVRNLYNNTSANQFASLIFQNEIIDAGNKNEEFTLIATPVDNTGTITSGQQKILLTPDKAKKSEKIKKVNLANLPMSRAQIKYFIDADPTGTLINHLYFSPKPYPDASEPDNPPYIAYSYVARSSDGKIAIKDLVGGDLNPSPPATPPS